MEHIGEFLNLGETAARLGISRTTLSKRISEGVLSPTSIGGFAVIPVDEVDRIEAEGLQLRKRGRKPQAN